MASWKENKKVGIVAGVFVVLAIVGVIYSMAPKKVFVTLKSESTGKVIKMKVKIGEVFPITDPETGKKDLYQAIGYKCANGHEFYVAITNDDQGASAVIPKCPVDATMDVMVIEEK